MRMLRLGAWLAVAAIAAATFYVVKGGTTQKAEADRRGANRGPVTVLAQPATLSDVPVYLEGVGSAKARNTVTVRPQVDGRLIAVNFKEGQDVKKGDVLAKIDPITYQAQLDQAKAKKALDEALLANTRRDLDRFERVGTLAVSQQQIDTQRALIKQQEAQIRSDDASIANLTAILGYTDIVAPIDGRTGLRLVDEGNLVRAGEQSAIVTITELRPISVLFTLPQQNLPALTRAIAGGPLVAEAHSTDRRERLDTGELRVLDNQVDAQTGTVRLKAEFPNEKLQLWPGQFVDVRLLVDTLKNVVVAPAAAVQRGPNGAFVFVITPENTAALRLVKTGMIDETQAVITEGLTAGDVVVTSGFGRLEDGSKVSIGEPGGKGKGTKGEAPATAKPASISDNAGDVAPPPSTSEQASDAAPAAVQSALPGSSAEAKEVQHEPRRHQRRDASNDAGQPSAPQ